MFAGLEAWETVVGATGGTAAAVTATVALYRKVIGPWRARRLSREAKIDEILKSTKPNGHGGVIDIVERIERDVGAIREEITLIKLLQFASLDVNRNAVWIADVNGRCIYASELLASHMGVPAVDVLDNGWKSQVADEYSEEVKREWQEAVREQRPFYSVYSFRTNPSRRFVGKTRVLRTSDRQVRGYIGTLDAVD